MKNKDREKVLLERVYKEIAGIWFKEGGKMIPMFRGKIEFSKGLAGDIANYVQGKNPDYYHLVKKREENRPPSWSYTSLCRKDDDGWPICGACKKRFKSESEVTFRSGPDPEEDSRHFTHPNCKMPWND